MKTVVFQTAFLGDLLLSLPLVRAIKLQDEDSELYAVIRGGLAEALQNNPDISGVIEYDKKRVGAGLQTSDLIKELRRHKFDRAIIPHRSFRTGLLCWLSAIPVRIGFFGSPGYVFYTESIEFLPTGHQILKYLTLAGEHGSDAERYPMTIYPSDENFDRADEVLSGITTGRAENVVSVAPGSVWATKRWLPGYFAELINRLITDYDFHAVLTGSPQEKDLCYQIGKELPSSGWAITAGRFSIMDTAALYARSSFVIANDSAAGHLASAVNTPVFTIYGPTVPEFGFYPIGKDNVIAEVSGLYCRPCSKHGPMKCPERHFRCMRELTPELALQRMEPMLEEL